MTCICSIQSVLYSVEVPTATASGPVSLPLFFFLPFALGIRKAKRPPSPHVLEVSASN